MKRLVAEFIGTFALVFTGTGAIVIDEVTGGAVTHVGAALTFGLIVLAMIYTLGDISGVHINPLLRSAFGFRDGLPLTTYCHMSQASAREPLPPVESCDFCFRKIGCSVRPFRLVRPCSPLCWNFS